MKLSYDDVGAGTPVLFMHGFPHNRSLWSAQVAGLAKDARCIVPDLRGFGESKAIPPWSMDQYADDMADLLSSLDIRNVVVAGLSMGGYVAFAMWRRHRNLVRALILADTRAGADSDEGKRKRDESIALARSQGVRALADVQITGMLGKSTRERSPETVARIHDMLASAPLEGVVGALQAMRDRPDSTEMLATIDVPVLVIVGDEDVLTPPKESQRMHEAIRQSTLEVIPGAGHLSNAEKPAEFNRAVAAFLAALAPA